MAVLDSVKEKYSQIPQQVKLFLLRALSLFLLWSVVYYFYLQPHQIIDPYFTVFTGKSVVEVLKLIYSAGAVTAKYTPGNCWISIQGVNTITILDGCNGLELYVLYLGFLACMPSYAKNMIIYGIVGVISIYIINVIRCVILASLQHVNYVYIDTVHHYIFTIVVYSFMFFLWVKYLRAGYNEKGLSV